MRRIHFVLSILICSTFLISATAWGESDLKAAALKKFQQAIIKALPVETQIVRIAVLDFEGDDGTFQNAMTSAITEKTNFKVIERKDLDKILEEQGLQLKDVMDEKTRIKHGKIKGVQGLLFGKVLGMEKGFMSYTLKVHLKFDDVEKGEILFSKDFNIKVVSPVRDWIIYGVIGIIILIVILIALTKRRATVVKTRIKEDVTVRVDITKEIARALTNISEAKAKLMNKGKTDEAVLLKDAERDLLLLKEHVDNAARGSADMRKAGEFKQVLSFDKAIMDSFENLTKSADRLYNKVLQGDLVNFEKETDGLKMDIKNTMNEFSHRKF
jgi:hypothetical protein